MSVRSPWLAATVALLLPAALAAAASSPADILLRQQHNLWRALYFAAKECDVDGLRDLLDSDDLPAERPDGPATHLHAAAELDCAPAVALLLEHPSGLWPGNARSGGQGASALHAAALANSPAVVRALAARVPALLRAPTTSGDLPTAVAAMRNASAALGALLEADPGLATAAATVGGDAGDTLLHTVASMSNFDTAAVVMRRWPQGAPPPTNQEGQSPVHLAAYVGNHEVLAAMLAHFAAGGGAARWCGAADADGDLALHLAAAEGHVRAVDALLAGCGGAAGAGVAVANANGKTPAMIAATDDIRTALRG